MHEHHEHGGHRGGHTIGHAAGQGPQASAAEVMAEEPAAMALRPIPVKVVGPVETRELGALQLAIWSRSVDTPERVFTRNPKVKSRYLVAGANLNIGVKQSQVNQTTPTGLVWPANTPLPLAAFDELWASAATAGTPVTVGLLEEVWTP